MENYINAFPKVLSDQLIRREILKGEYFVHEGQSSNQIAFVQSGYLRTYQIDYQGNDVTINFHTPGAFCGSYYGFYTKMPALDNMIAITDCILQTISYESLMALYEDSLAANKMGRKIIEQVCITKDFRIAKMLQTNGEDRYRWFLETYPEIIRVAQMQHIASFLGMKPETLSRIRRKIIS